MKFQEKLLEIFQNTELLKSIRTGLFITIVVVLPFYYFGYKDTFEWETLTNAQYGVISLITTLSIIMMTYETKLRAFDITFKVDKDLPKHQEDARKNAQEITQLDKTFKRTTKEVDNYNQSQQNMYNEIKTNNEIMRLENRVRSLRLRGKESKAKSIEKVVANIKENGLVDKHFKPYDVRRIVIIENNTLKLPKKKGNNEISVDPKSFNPFKSIFTSGIRGLGLGVTASMPFIINESFKTIVIFYLSYLLIIAVSMLVQYIVSSYIMQNSYKRSLTRIIDIQELIIKKLKGDDSVSNLEKGEEENYEG
jgi:hypothetical protein